MLAMATVPGTSQIMVLLPKLLRVYDTDLGSSLHPTTCFTHQWEEAENRPDRGCLKPSTEGSYVLVWRWMLGNERSAKGRAKSTFL